MRTGGCDSRFIVSDSKANDCCFREALKDNVFHRPPSPHTCCVDPAADQEGHGGVTRSPGMDQPPFSHTHLSSSSSSSWSDCYSSLPRAADPATSRGQLCSRRTLSQEPLRKSAAAHRGNLVRLGVPAQAGTICLGALTQERRCQGGFPPTCLDWPGLLTGV